VGVCCTSLKKICGVLKRHCLGYGKPEVGGERNHTYDGMVLPVYRRYPLNAEACANIVRRAWNPPTDVIRRWVEMCRPAGWSHNGVYRMICLNPLNIQERELTMDMVRVYVDELRDNLQTIADQSLGWRQRDQVETVIIPV
jgi:hypothetical protein